MLALSTAQLLVSHWIHLRDDYNGSPRLALAEYTEVYQFAVTGV